MPRFMKKLLRGRDSAPAHQTTPDSPPPTARAQQQRASATTANMSSKSEITKRQVTNALNSASYMLVKRTLESANEIIDTDSFTGLPEAFPVVAKHLQVLVDLLQSTETYLAKNAEVDQVIQEQYEALFQLGTACDNQAKYLDELFVAVSGTDYPAAKIKRYGNLVLRNGGTKMETAFKELLEQAKPLAFEPLVEEALAKKLNEALEEVKRLKPSLQEDLSGHTVLNHYGSGDLFHSGGSGSQFNCTGGVQVAGSGATNHFGVEHLRNAKAST